MTDIYTIRALTYVGDMCAHTTSAHPRTRARAPICRHVIQWRNAAGHHTHTKRGRAVAAHLARTIIILCSRRRARTPAAAAAAAALP